MRIKSIIPILLISLLGQSSFALPTPKACADTSEVVLWFRYVLAMVVLEPQQQALAVKFEEILDSADVPSIQCTEDTSADGVETKQLIVSDQSTTIEGVLVIDEIGGPKSITFTKR